MKKERQQKPILKLISAVVLSLAMACSFIFKDQEVFAKLKESNSNVALNSYSPNKSLSNLEGRNGRPLFLGVEGTFLNVEVYEEEDKLSEQKGLTSGAYLTIPSETPTRTEDLQFKYTLSGWYLDYTDTVYELATYPAGTKILDVSTILSNTDFQGDLETKTVKFEAVYDVEYKNSFEFVSDLYPQEETEPVEKLHFLSNEVGSKFTVKYKVATNDGINSLVLIPEYDKETFKIVDAGITTESGTALGSATLGSGSSNTILFESENVYEGTDDILVSITYELIKHKVGEYEFTFHFDYPKNTHEVESLESDGRSLAFGYNEEFKSEQIEYEVSVTPSFHVYCTGEGIVTAEKTDLKKVYDLASFNVDRKYSKINPESASSYSDEDVYYFDETTSSYKLYKPEETLVDKTTFIQSGEAFALTDGKHVVYTYNGENLVDDYYCSYNWYTKEGQTYTKLEAAPTDAGTYYVEVEVAPNDYYTQAISDKVEVTIEKADITITPSDASSKYGESFATLTGTISGVEFPYTELNIEFKLDPNVISSTSDAGEYKDAIIVSYDTTNTNFNVTTSKATYTITKADNSWTTELTTTDREYNQSGISVGSSTSTADYFAEAANGTVSYSFFDSEKIAFSGTPTDAGTYYIKASVPALTNYNALESDYVKIVISKCKITELGQINGSSKEYNASEQTWATTDFSIPSDAKYTLTSVSKIEGNNYTNAGKTNVLVNATITDTYAANYEFAEGKDSASIEVEITKYAIIVTVSSQTKGYTGSDITPDTTGFTISIADGDLPAFVNTDTTLNIKVVKGEDGQWISQGYYIITATNDSEVQNYSITVVTSKLNITANLIPIPNLECFIYDGEAHTPVLTGIWAQYCEIVTEGSDLNKINADTYKVVIKLKDPDNTVWGNIRPLESGSNWMTDGYYIKDDDGKFVQVHLMAGHSEKAAAHQTYYEYKTGLPVYKKVTKFEQYGVDNWLYHIYDPVFDVYDLYNDLYEAGKIAKLTADNFDQFEVYSITKETRDGYIPNGSYIKDIIQGYTGNVTVNWVIRPKYLDITVDSKEMTYGGTIPTFSVTKEEGLVDKDKPTEGLAFIYTFNLSESYDVGTYDIGLPSYSSPKDGPLTSNYELRFKTQPTLKVNPKTIGSSQSDLERIIEKSIKTELKEYDGGTIVWSTTKSGDFTIDTPIEGQLNNDDSGTIIYVDSATANGTYVDANGILDNTSGWTYYKNGSDDIIYTYSVVVNLKEGTNYQFYGGVTSVTVNVPVRIKKAENFWTEQPTYGVQTTTTDERVETKSSAAKFGDNATSKNFVGIYSDEDCTTPILVANLAEDTTYYAKFSVTGNDNYFGLEKIISFKLSLLTTSVPTIYFGGKVVTTFSEEVIFDGLAKYFAADATNTILYNANNSLTGYSYTISSGNDKTYWLDVGEYKLVFKLNDGYYWEEAPTGYDNDDELTYTLTIKKADLTLELPSVEVTYKEDLTAITTCTPTGFVNNESFTTTKYNCGTIPNYFTYTYTKGAAVSADPIPVSWTDAGKQALTNSLYNYDITFKDGSITIKPIEITVGSAKTNQVYMEDLTVIYDGQAHTLEIVGPDYVTATYTIDGKSDNQAIDVKFGLDECIKKYTVVATLAFTNATDDCGNKYSNSNCYAFSSPTITGYITINQKQVKIYPDDKSSGYGEDLKPFTFTYDPEGGIYARDNITVTASAKNSEGETLSNDGPRGVYNIIPTASGTGFKNYNLVYMWGKYTLGKGSNSFTVTALVTDSSRQYNGSNLAKGTDYDFTVPNDTGNDPVVTITKYDESLKQFVTCSNFAEVGKYQIVVFVEGNEQYFNDFTSEPIEITITKKQITSGYSSDKDIYILDKEVYYNGEEQTIPLQYSSDKLAANFASVTKQGSTNVNWTTRPSYTFIQVSYDISSFFDPTQSTYDGVDTYGYKYKDNYELATGCPTTLTAKLTIKPLEIQVTIDDIESYYGDSHVINSSDVTYTITNEAPSGSGLDLAAICSADEVKLNNVSLKGVEGTLPNTTGIGEYTLTAESLVSDKIDNYIYTIIDGKYKILKAKAKLKEGTSYLDDTTTDNSGVKASILVSDTYYNRSLTVTSAAKVGTLNLSSTDYVVKYSTSETGTYSTTAPTNAGTYYAIVEVTATDNYEGGTSAPISFEIKKVQVAAPTLSYNGDTVTWTDPTSDTGKTSDEDGVEAKALVDGVTFTYKADGEDYSSATYSIDSIGKFSITLTPSNDNYLPVTVETKQAIKVTFSEGDTSKSEQTGHAFHEEWSAGSNFYLHEEPIPDVYVFEGESVSKPDLIDLNITTTKTEPGLRGYDFVGWFIGDTEYKFDTGIEDDDDHVVDITCHWTIWKINVYFYDSADETTAFASETNVDYDATKAITCPNPNNPTKENDGSYSYDFVGWYSAFNTDNTCWSTMPKYIASANNATIKIYAAFNKTAEEFTITLYLSIDGSEYTEYKALEGKYAYNSNLSEIISSYTLTTVKWFKGDIWYLDEARTNKVSNTSTMPAENLKLYGSYVFDIGNGDINGDNKVNTDDITLYRQFIVGGYDITKVTPNTEYELGKSYQESEIIYFFNRVADVNASIEGSKQLDIRDVSTIRMAIVGGFNWFINEGIEVTGQSVTRNNPNSAYVYNKAELLAALEAKREVIFVMDDIDLEDTSIDVTYTTDLTLQLNNHDIVTTGSFSIKNEDTNDTLEIKNGSITASSGVSFEFPKGNIKLESLVVADESGTISLDAFTSSIHFYNVVKFVKGDATSDTYAPVTIPSDTRIVIEAEAQVFLEKIVVTPVENKTLVIENKSSEDEIVKVEGDVIVSGNVEVVEEISEEETTTTAYVTTEEQLLYALLNGFNVYLDADITFDSRIQMYKDAYINLNGHVLTDVVRNPKPIGLYINQETTSDDVPTLTIDGNTEGSKYVGMIGVGRSGNLNGNVVLDGGTYEAGLTGYYVIASNGSCSNSNITITNATLTAEDNAVQYPSGGNLTITNSEITGYTAVYVKAGNITITDTKLHATGVYVGYSFNGNGSNPTGDALVIDNCNYPHGNATIVSLEGTTYTVADDNAQDVGTYNYVTSFASGSGTSDSPYMVTMEEELLLIDDFFNTGKSDVYFKLDADMDMSKPSIQGLKQEQYSRKTWFQFSDTETYIHLDLNNKTIDNLSCFLFTGLQNIEISNGTVDFTNNPNSDSKLDCPGLVYYNEIGKPRNWVFKDLVLTGDYEVNMLHYGPLVSQSWEGGKALDTDDIVVDGVTSSVKINNVCADAYTGGMFGYVYGPLTIKNSTFNGSIQSALAGGFINPMNAGGTKVNENNTFNGILLGTTSVQKFGSSIDTVDNIGTDAIASKITKSETLLSNSMNYGAEIIINHTDDEIVRYAVSIFLWTNQATCTTVFNVDVNATSTECHTGLYKNYFENADVDESTEQNRVASGWFHGNIWKEGDTYKVHSTSDCKIKTEGNPTATIYVYGYDAQGTLKVYQTQSYTLTK